MSYAYSNIDGGEPSLIPTPTPSPPHSRSGSGSVLGCDGSSPPPVVIVGGDDDEGFSYSSNGGSGDDKEVFDSASDGGEGDDDKKTSSSYVSGDLEAAISLSAPPNRFTFTVEPHWKELIAHKNKRAERKEANLPADQRRVWRCVNRNTTLGAFAVGMNKWTWRVVNVGLYSIPVTVMYAAFAYTRKSAVPSLVNGLASLILNFPLAIGFANSAKKQLELLSHGSITPLSFYVNTVLGFGFGLLTSVSGAAIGEDGLEGWMEKFPGVVYAVGCMAFNTLTTRFIATSKVLQEMKEEFMRHWNQYFLSRGTKDERQNLIVLQQFVKDLLKVGPQLGEEKLNEIVSFNAGSGQLNFNPEALYTEVKEKKLNLVDTTGWGRTLASSALHASYVTALLLPMIPLFLKLSTDGWNSFEEGEGDNTTLTVMSSLTHYFFYGRCISGAISLTKRLFNVMRERLPGGGVTAVGLLGLLLGAGFLSGAGYAEEMFKAVVDPGDGYGDAGEGFVKIGLVAWFFDLCGKGIVYMTQASSGVVNYAGAGPYLIETCDKALGSPKVDLVNKAVGTLKAHVAAGNSMTTLFGNQADSIQALRRAAVAERSERKAAKSESSKNQLNTGLISSSSGGLYGATGNTRGSSSSVSDEADSEGGESNSRVNPCTRFTNWLCGR